MIIYYRRISKKRVRVYLRKIDNDKKNNEDEKKNALLFGKDNDGDQ